VKFKNDLEILKIASDIHGEITSDVEGARIVSETGQYLIQDILENKYSTGQIIATFYGMTLALTEGVMRKIYKDEN